MTTIEQWNTRAGYLRVRLDEPEQRHEPSPLDVARETMARWRRLVEAVPPRALAAAAHQGLQSGPVALAVERHRRGCLVLAGTPGAGKSVGAAWLAYQTQGSVLWLDAQQVGLARNERHAPVDRLQDWKDEIRKAALVVLDDVGAGTSSGEWSSLKVRDIAGACLDRQGPSVILTNYDREAFARATSARIASRASMRPNVWIDIQAPDRRPTADPPPDIDTLPPREADAHTLIQSREVMRRAHQAYVMADVDEPRIREAARLLGFESWQQVDRGVAEHERRAAEVQALVISTGRRLRLAVPDAEPKKPEAEVVAAQVRRCAVLDLLANVAEAQGVGEAEVLERLGRARRDLGPGDETALREMLAGVACG